MSRYILLCLFPPLFYFQITLGQIGENAACRAEHGACTKHVYENIRLAALRSSDCQKFCQCVHASTELDGSVTYMWVQQECPPTTLFDDSLPAPVCNHAANVQCHGTYDEEDCSSEHGTCTKFIYENVRLVPQRSSGCKKFCQCAHASTQLDGSVTYHWVEHVCPAGTLFDSRIRVCNHEHNVQCTGSGQGNNGGNVSPVTEPSGGQVPVVSGENDCFEEYGSCTKNQYENVRLVALKSSGCKNFCQCTYASTEMDGSVTYKWVKKECPERTLFDESLPTPVCNHDYNVKCEKEESEDCESEHGTCTRYVYENVRLVPKRSSGCEKFCQCAHASTEMDGSVTYKWVEHNCPAGLLFDENIKVCNYPRNVECSSVDNTEEEKELEQIEEIITSPAGDDADCIAEYGRCNQYTYEHIRLVALKSSGCKNFCQCEHASTQADGSVTYKWAKQICPPTTLFDMALPTPVCNHDYLVECPSVGDTGDSCLKELGTCTKSEYEVKRLAALRSSGCKNFCQCAHASTEPDGSVTYYWAEHTCPANTLFDETLPTPVCNWADQVQC